MVERSKEIFRNLVNLHNDIAVKRKDEFEFDNYVLSNLDLLDNPDYLQILLERIYIDDEEYFINHHELCLFIYNLILKYPECYNSDYGLRTCMRIGIFEDSFKVYFDNLSN